VCDLVGVTSDNVIDCERPARFFFADSRTSCCIVGSLCRASLTEVGEEGTCDWLQEVTLLNWNDPEFGVTGKMEASEGTSFRGVETPEGLYLDTREGWDVLRWLRGDRDLGLFKLR
jgi:hypothetical protein